MSKFRCLITVCSILTGLAAMTQTQIVQMKHDPHSFARPYEAVIIHMDLDIEVSFDKKIIKGEARYKIGRYGESPTLVLDIRDLQIQGVFSGKQALEFTVSASQPFVGSALSIPLPEGITEVRVQYQTTPTATALQWLSPRQTLGGKYPFLFTQSQAILARTWIPVQDSPGIRFTYNATVRVPSGMLALMSAENPRVVSADGKYSFSMQQPVPAYLMALAVGHLSYCSLGDKTGLYAEPEILDKAAWEFSETEDMLKAAEKLYGTYRWDVYDLLVLPPSFPFGGMENPRLTFATPTILAGDRSLTSLVAHELAHSWSGNLVTNASWNDFWLNEGFTVYFERRIMEALHGPEYSDMLASLGYQDLVQTNDTFINNGRSSDTRLKLQLDGRDPDDGMSDIAYEKGYFFLKLIENHSGRERFDRFIRQWFGDNAFQAKTTEDFLQYLRDQLLNQQQYEQIRVEEWIYDTGLPQNLPKPRGIRFERVDTVVETWKSKQYLMPTDTASWSAHEWLHFVRSVTNGANARDLEDLDRSFNFTHSSNAEIKAAWLLAAVKCNYTPSWEALEKFLTTVGRRKFIVPIYKAMNQHGLQKLSIEIYKKARPGYHAVAIETLDKLIPN